MGDMGDGSGCSIVAHLGPLKKQTGPFGKKQITQISKFPLFE
jgi:hypothetical protein